MMRTVLIKQAPVSLVVLVAMLLISVLGSGTLLAQATKDSDAEHAIDADKQVPEGNIYEIEIIVYAIDVQEEVEQYPLLLNLHYPDQVDRFPEDTEALTITEPTDYGEYVLLESDEDGLGPMADNIAEESGYSILLHKRWLQYIPEREQDRYLLIEGGASYGGYRELQGVLLVYLKRYLHIKLELWLSDFTTSGTSPQPLPPLPPRKEEKDEIQLFQTEVGAFRRKARNVVDDLNAQLGANAKLPVVRRIVRLQEDRRVRSQELHHFDHPRMGVLLRIKVADPQSR